MQYTHPSAQLTVDEYNLHVRPRVRANRARRENIPRVRANRARRENIGRFLAVRTQEENWCHHRGGPCGVPS
eukprot:2255762-Pyramimonas_sp.AAC.1